MSLISVASLSCGNCGNEFPLNASSQPESITCPYCQTKMSDDMIGQVYDALLTVGDVNYHFIKYQQERDEALFQLNVKSQEVKLAGDSTRQE